MALTVIRSHGERSRRLCGSNMAQITRQSDQSFRLSLNDDEQRAMVWLEENGQREALGEYITLWIRDRQAQLTNTARVKPAQINNSLIRVVEFL